MIERAGFLSTQARDPAPHYEHTTFGYNYRLSNVCAAIGVAQLRVLAARAERRRRITVLYQERLGALPRFSQEAEGMRANRWLTTVLIDPAEAGVDREAMRLTGGGADREPALVKSDAHARLFAEAKVWGGAAAARAFGLDLCLPSCSSMTDSDVERVCAIVTDLAAR